MGAGNGQRAAVSVQPSSRQTHASSTARDSLASRFAGWETHIYPGLRLPGVALETRSALARALGEVGTEAEYILNTCFELLTATRFSPAEGGLFLGRIEHACRRLAGAGAALEVAIQSYLAAMEARTPGLSTRGDGDEWWSEEDARLESPEPFEFRLRRCGFSYRQVVQVHIGAHLEDLIEQLSCFLLAVLRLPPAGVLPAASLYTGLYGLAMRVQGDVVLHHIFDVSDRYPGLLTGISQLRELAAAEDTSLESDLAWAYAQRAYILNQAHALEQAGGRLAPNEIGTLRAQALRAASEWEAIIHELARLNRPLGQP